MSLRKKSRSGIASLRFAGQAAKFHSQALFALAFRRGEPVTAKTRRLCLRILLVDWASILFLSFAVSGQGTPSPGKRPIRVADCVGMAKLELVDNLSGAPSIVQFSPDGEQFVVVLKKANIEADTNDFSLLLYRTADVFPTPKPDVLLRRSSSSYRAAITKVRWLGDNETLVFLGEDSGEASQIYEFNVITRILTQLTHHGTAITNYDITPDGRNIVFAADPPEEKGGHPQRGPSKGVVIAGQNLYDVLTGDYSQSKGKQLFWQEWGHSARLIPFGTEYFIAGYMASVSPNGQYVVLPVQIRDVQSHSGWAKYEDSLLQQFFAANIPNGMISPLQQLLLVDTKALSIVPLLDAPVRGPAEVTWAGDGESVFLTSYLPLDTADPSEQRAREQNKYSIEVKLSSLKYKKVPETDRPRHEAPRAPVDVGLEQDVNSPPKLYAAERSGRQKALLLDLNPEFSDLEFGRVMPIEWTVDGIEMTGGLYLPPSYMPGKRYPLVIQTHGFILGEFSMDGRSEWSSGFAARPLAAKGIMVLQTHNFKNRQEVDRVVPEGKLGATNEESRKNLIAHSYERAVDYLDERGLIDPKRVGIVGFSRTVCDVGYLLTHSKHRFAAASLVDGISCSYLEELALPDEAFDINSVNGGGPPFGDGLKLWMKNAPGFNLDKVHTPVSLISLGNWSALSAWEWYAGLSFQRKPVNFVVVPDATHIGVKPSQRMLTEQSIVDWFCFWLIDEEDPDPAKREQYTRWRELRVRSDFGMPSVSSDIDVP